MTFKFKVTVMYKMAVLLLDTSGSVKINKSLVLCSDNRHLHIEILLQIDRDILQQ